MLRKIGHSLAGLAAWSLTLTPLAEAQFRPQAAITRTLPSIVSALRPQDVFATSLITGSSSADRVVTNGLDLLGKGGMVWPKGRSPSGLVGGLVDTVRGNTKVLVAETTAAEVTSSAGSDLKSFNANGFTLGSANQMNVNLDGNSVVAWSFRRASKFFDIVTYTGDGTSGRVIPHALGIKPGMIIVKQRDNVRGWPVYHKDVGASNVLFLNLTNASAPNSSVWSSSEPDATGFIVGNNSNTNTAGAPYVAYLFAHDPDTTNGIVQCGSFTTDGGGNATVNLGWAPQWLLYKSTSYNDNWNIMDTSRGWGVGNDLILAPNTSAADYSAQAGAPSSTGFLIGPVATNQSFIFCTIRAPI